MTTAESILETIGREAMERLCREFGGTTLYIPLRPPEVLRNEKIVTLFSHALKAGGTCMSAYNECAQEFGLSVRRVQEIIAG